MGGVFHCFGDAFCAGTWNVNAVTSVVVRGRYKVPPIHTVGVLCAGFVSCLVYYDSCAWWCEGCAVEFKWTVQLGFRQQSWIETGRMEEVEC